MKKILLRYYSRLNFGDDLFVKLFSEQFSTCRIELLGNPLYIPRSLGSNVYISPWSWPVTLIGKLQGISSLGKQTRSWLQSRYNQFVERAKTENDACVIIGGSLFPDYADSANSQPLSFSVPESCPRDYSFKSNVNPTGNEFLVGANLGPVYHHDYFERMKSAFSQYAHVCLRDYASYHPFRNDPHIQYAPDVGFLHDPKSLSQRSDTVVLSIIDASHHTKDPIVVYTYDTFMANTASKFAAMGKEVILLSLCRREGDEIAAQRILDLIPDRTNIQTYTYCGDLEAVFSIFSNASLVVATRFHSMIMGFVYAKPVFPIVYNCKIEHYLQDLCYHGAYATLATLDQFSVNDMEKSDVFDCSIHKKYAHVQFKALREYLKD